MSYYPAAIAKALLPTLMAIETTEAARSSARAAARGLVALIEADAFPSPASDVYYAKCQRIAHDSLLGEIENDQNMLHEDFLVADFLLDVITDNKLRSVAIAENEIVASTGVAPDDVRHALVSLCAAGYFRAIRPSHLECELGFEAVKYEPQLEESLLNAHQHRVSVHGSQPDTLRIKGRQLVTYSENDEGKLEVRRP